MAVTMASPPPLSPVTIANTPLQPHGSDGCITPPPPPPSYLTSPRTSSLMAVTVASSLSIFSSTSMNNMSSRPLASPRRNRELSTRPTQERMDSYVRYWTSKNNRQIHADTNTMMNQLTNMYMYTHTKTTPVRTNTHTYTNKQTHKQTDTPLSQVDQQRADRQTDRQTHRQTDTPLSQVDQ